MLLRKRHCDCEQHSPPAFKAWNNTSPSASLQADLTSTEQRSDVYIQAVSLCRPAALFVLEVCCASRPNHMQSCVFPGWLYVNSSHSHTFPHTEIHEFKCMHGTWSKKAIKPHSVTEPCCTCSHKKCVYTQRETPRESNSALKKSMFT